MIVFFITKSTCETQMYVMGRIKLDCFEKTSNNKRRILQNIYYNEGCRSESY